MAFVQDYPGEPVPEETFTHSHLSWSLTILYQLPPSLTRLTVFLHNFYPSPLWSTSWSCTLHFIFHTFLQSLSSFCNTSHAIATCYAVVPKLCHLILVCLSTLLGTLSFTLMPHIHLTSLISAHWSATSFFLTTLYTILLSDNVWYNLIYVERNVELQPTNCTYIFVLM